MVTIPLIKPRVAEVFTSTIHRFSDRIIVGVDGGGASIRDIVVTYAQDGETMQATIGEFSRWIAKSKAQSLPPADSNTLDWNGHLDLSQKGWHYLRSKGTERLPMVLAYWHPVFLGGNWMLYPDTEPHVPARKVAERFHYHAPQPPKFRRVSA